jgi:hypothetical protein
MRWLRCWRWQNSLRRENSATAHSEHSQSQAIKA